MDKIGKNKSNNIRYQVHSMHRFNTTDELPNKMITPSTLIKIVIIK